VLTQSSAELQILADKARWNEHQDARLKKQHERLGLLTKKQKAIEAEIVICNNKIAALKDEIAKGVQGFVPRPTPGGVVVDVPAGQLKVEGK
jgi:hypothetical protein